jgi:hypothetical protein
MLKDFKKGFSVEWEDTEKKDLTVKLLTLSTGSRISEFEKPIMGMLELIDYVYRNHRSELTWWGKLSWIMNQ